MKTSEHLRLQEESPILRVSCEVMNNGSSAKQKLVTTDANLQADILQALTSFGLCEATRSQLIDLLKTRTGRYGLVRTFDTQTGAYVAVAVTPDPVIGTQIIVGDRETNDMILQSDLAGRLEAVLQAAELPPDAREEIIRLLSGKESFSDPIRFDRADERKRIAVRIGYINSSAFVTQPAQEKKKKWQGPGS